MPDLFDSNNLDLNPEDKDIFTVSRLNFEARSLLELSFPRIWLEGEISNLAQPKSGHWYFSLKDEKSQVRCVMFRGQNSKLKFKPEAGQQVLIRAQVGMYEARGEFQLSVLSMQEYGDGPLLKKFEELKKNLQEKGWFANDIKQPIPEIPTTIGVISSDTGAVIHDILTTLNLRFPAIRVVVYPAKVQGSGAAGQIAKAIDTANARKDAEVLIVGRGGGSLEDLWAFNELEVAKAIFKSELPVVSAAGHESDVTIADFVADLRAATPTAAAQILSPDQKVFAGKLEKLQRTLTVNIKNLLELKSAKIVALSKGLASPGAMLLQITQRLDELETRLGTGLSHQLAIMKTRIENLKLRLGLNHPVKVLDKNQSQVTELKMKLIRAYTQSLTGSSMQLKIMAKNLDAISPLKVLGRGYSIVQNERGKIIKVAGEVRTGEEIKIKLHSGKLKAKVK